MSDYLPALLLNIVIYTQWKNRNVTGKTVNVKSKGCIKSRMGHGIETDVALIGRTRVPALLPTHVNLVDIMKSKLNWFFP